MRLESIDTYYIMSSVQYRIIDERMQSRPFECIAILYFILADYKKKTRFGVIMQSTGGTF